MVKCQYCDSGTDYKRIGGHWTRSNCGPRVKQLPKNLLFGMLLSSGTLHKPEGGSSNSTPTIKFQTANENYIQFIKNKLGTLSTEVSVHEYDNPEMDFGEIYKIHTRTNEAVVKLVKDWYNGEVVRPPDDFELLPETAKIWFAQKGNVRRRDEGYRFRLGYRSTNRSGEYWIDKLPNLNWETIDGGLRLESKEDVRRALEYVSPPVDCVSWRWDMDEEKPNTNL